MESVISQGDFPESIEQEKDVCSFKTDYDAVNTVEDSNKTLNIIEEKDVTDSDKTVENSNKTLINLEETNEIRSKNETLNEAVILIKKPLCANYRSSSESDSSDSECDSSSSVSSTSSTSTYSSESEKEKCSIDHTNSKKKTDNSCNKFDVSLSNLPPIEDLKISVPEKLSIEIGIITSIVDTLVIVEAYKGTAPLDVDTVLFLEQGKKPLGKIFEILGPVSEPIYTVRFNSQEDISKNTIVKGLKVYYAPNTEHTTFVFLSEVLKNRGSDASWKDNIEAPSEFQDFSDDEEENQFKKELLKQNNGTSDSRKRRLNCSPSNNTVMPNIYSNENARKFEPRNNSFHFSQNSFRPRHLNNPIPLPQTNCSVPPPFPHNNLSGLPNGAMNCSSIPPFVNYYPYQTGVYPPLRNAHPTNIHPRLPPPFVVRQTTPFPPPFRMQNYFNSTLPPPPPPPPSS